MHDLIKPDLLWQVCLAIRNAPFCLCCHHALRIYMARLRQKLEQAPAQPRYLLTETGVGYRLAAGYHLRQALSAASSICHSLP